MWSRCCGCLVRGARSRRSIRFRSTNCARRGFDWTSALLYHLWEVRPLDLYCRTQRIKSAHFWVSPAAEPHGSIGTLDVEFFGDPSINLSLYVMKTSMFRFVSHPLTICIFLKKIERRSLKTTSPCENFALNLTGPY